MVTTCYYRYPEGISMTSTWQKKGIVEGVARLLPNTKNKIAVDILSAISAWCTLSKTSIIKKYGGFFDQYRCLYGEDAHLYLKIILNEPFGFILTPHVNHYVDASELAYNYPSFHDMAHFLKDPSEIVSTCPDNMVSLLNGILEYRALQYVINSSKFSRGRSARTLLVRFPPSGRVSRRFRNRAKLWSLASYFYPEIYIIRLKLSRQFPILGLIKNRYLKQILIRGIHKN
jgi:hypothetical protein